MSERGVFAVDRGIWDHPLFADEAFTEREAWLWLVSSAVWKASKVRVGNKMVPLDRGELAFSERFLATKWGWSKTTVHRFLLLLESESMIVRKADHVMDQITICNYDRYAFDGTSKRTTNGPDADQIRTKEEEPKKVIRKEEEERGRAKRATRLPDDWVPSDDDKLFALGRGMSIEGIRIEAIKFRNYWTAKGGQGATKINWERTWQNWVLNSNGASNGTAKPKTGGNTGGSLIAAIDRQLAALQAQDGTDLEMPKGPVLRISNGPVR